MRLLILCLLSVLLYNCNTPSTAANNKSVLGKWAYNHSHDNNTYHDMIASFKADGTYDGIEDGKVFVSGTYLLANDTLSLTDQFCSPHSTGTYKIKFSTDSLYFNVISDSCEARRNGTDGTGYKRL